MRKLKEIEQNTPSRENKLNDYKAHFLEQISSVTSQLLQMEVLRSSEDNGKLDEAGSVLSSQGCEELEEFMKYIVTFKQGFDTKIISEFLQKTVDVHNDKDLSELFEAFEDVTKIHFRTHLKIIISQKKRAREKLKNMSTGGNRLAYTKKK